MKLEAGIATGLMGRQHITVVLEHLPSQVGVHLLKHLP